MKKILKLGLALLLLLTIVGCDNKEDGPKVSDFESEEKNVLADKTYYGIYEEEDGSHGFVQFNKDYSFNACEYSQNGPVVIKGTYVIKESVVTVTVNECAVDTLKEVKFHIINEDVINLMTNMVSSIMGNTFIACEGIDNIGKAIDNQRANAKEIIDGKTFYDTVDRYGNTDTACICFIQDGTFEMYDHYLEGFVGIKGTWEVIDGYKIHCTISEIGLGEYKEIDFYIRDYATLNLQTDLFSSKDGDKFINREVCLDATETPRFDNTYDNASSIERGDFGSSNLVLRPDGTFSLTEVVGMGATLVNGLYGREGDILMFSNFDSTIYNMYGEELFNFEFRIVDDNTLELMKDLEGSKAGDCFSTNGKVPANYEPRFKAEEMTYITYIHEPIQDVNEIYLPNIQLRSDNTFSIIENVYAGMAEIQGYWSDSTDGYLLTVTDNTSMKGFAGEDVEYIILESYPDKVIIRTDICMTRDGDIFYAN